MQSSYPSKLLLFGEYTVLSGSQALAVPLPQWKGYWAQTEDTNDQSDGALTKYLDWLKSSAIISPEIETRIIRDAKSGWTYTSNIPIGFGLGSSGSYVAALYDRYISQPKTDIASIHKTLAKMEGYFHGSSSGMDPLVSLTQKAIYKSDQGDLQIIDDPGWPQGYSIFLLDTGQARSTGALVKIYAEKMKESGFRQTIQFELLPMMEHAIHFYLNGAATGLIDCIQIISDIQRRYFDAFIPKGTKQQWDTFLHTTGVHLKFCGAGGGGFFLGITTPEFTGQLPENAIQVNAYLNQE